MNQLGLMCFIMLEKPSRLDPAAVRQALAKIAPRSDLVVSERDPGGGGSGLMIEIDEHSYAIVSEPGLMPEEICTMVGKGGTFWADREQDLAAHNGFIAISAAQPAKGHGLVRAQAVALTRLAVAISRTVAALGLIWPGAGTAVPTARLDTVLEQIQKDLWPIDIWIGFQLGRATRGERQIVAARSRGAATYFGSEIEVFPPPTDEKVRPLRILMHVARHLMAYGVHVQQGQPIHIKGEPTMQILLLPPQDGGPGTIRLIPAEASAG